MEKLNKQMDDVLNTKVAALNATDDETGDGKVDALDLKHQLDRVEAQLELQDQQNRALLRSQKRLLWAAIAHCGGALPDYGRTAAAVQHGV